MNKISNEFHHKIADLLEVDGVKPIISTKQLQMYFDYPCGCMIAQDNKGNWFFPCKTHININTKIKQHEHTNQKRKN